MRGINASEWGHRADCECDLCVAEKVEHFRRQREAELLRRAAIEAEAARAASDAEYSEALACGAILPPRVTEPEPELVEV